MACEKCTDLMQAIVAERPSELEMVLRVVQANLGDGTIVPESSIPGSVLPPVVIETLNPAGPWPDALESAFRCTQCGQRFRLDVETYHGAGGSWQPLDAASLGGDRERAQVRDSARLLEVLGRMIDLLHAYSIGDWAAALSDIGARQADEDVRRDIRRLFGGAGSLNDLILHCADRARTIADNTEFEALKSELYEFGR